VASTSSAGPLHQWDRTQCGVDISDEASCTRQGCLWGALTSSFDAEEHDPWCYNPFTSQCAVNGDARKPFMRYVAPSSFTMEAGKLACETAGGCWQPTAHGDNRPWCFESKTPNQWAAKADIEVVSTRDGPDWTTVNCPAGKYLLGGGCQADGAPHVFEQNGPSSNTAWTCGGHSMKKHVYAICSTIKTSVEEHASGNDWDSFSCNDESAQMVGGGCKSAGDAYKFQANRPWGNADEWQCGGHGSGKWTSVICAAKADIKMDVATYMYSGDWHTVTCANDMTVIGGGCIAETAPFVMEASRPQGNGWECGGHGGQKSVYAMCGHEGTARVEPTCPVVMCAAPPPRCTYTPSTMKGHDGCALHPCGVLHCEPNVCTCAEGTGTAATGVACTTHGEEICASCANGHRMVGTTCVAHTPCTSSQYETAPGTLTSDRQCKALTTCTTTQWEKTEETANSDRVCQDLTTCTATQWQTMAAGTHHDRVCEELTTCSADQFELGKRIGLRWTARTGQTDCADRRLACGPATRRTVLFLRGFRLSSKR
jgi:hypothetical protein